MKIVHIEHMDAKTLFSNINKGDIITGASGYLTNFKECFFVTKKYAYKKNIVTHKVQFLLDGFYCGHSSNEICYKKHMQKIEICHDWMHHTILLRTDHNLGILFDLKFLLQPSEEIKESMFQKLTSEK